MDILRRLKYPFISLLLIGLVTPMIFVFFSYAKTPYRRKQISNLKFMLQYLIPPDTYFRDASQHPPVDTHYTIHLYDNIVYIDNMKCLKHDGMMVTECFASQKRMIQYGAGIVNANLCKYLTELTNMSECLEAMVSVLNELNIELKLLEDPSEQSRRFLRIGYLLSVLPNGTQHIRLIGKDDYITLAVQTIAGELYAVFVHPAGFSYYLLTDNITFADLPSFASSFNIRDHR